MTTACIKSSPRAIFALMQCVRELSKIANSLRIDALRERHLSTDSLSNCTHEEMNSYRWQALCSFGKAGASLLSNEMLRHGIQAFGEVPQHLLQGKLNASSADKSTFTKNLEESHKTQMNAEQLTGRLLELLQDAIRKSALA